MNGEHFVNWKSRDGGKQFVNKNSGDLGYILLIRFLGNEGVCALC